MKVATLYFYPVKSLRGIAVQEATLMERGLKWDRRWMIVDREGNFLTQRQLAGMALVNVSMDRAEEYITFSLDEQDVDACSWKVDDFSQKQRMVKVWDSEVMAHDMPEYINEWLSEVLGEEVALVFMSDQSIRYADRNYTKEEVETSFADGYPYLVVNTASLKLIQNEVSSSMSMLRFRPNVVIEGNQAWDEDHWFVLKHDRYTLELVKPCGRCQVITIDPMTGMAGKEPLTFLSNNHASNNKVIFGQNGILKLGIGERIKVGDEVEVISRQ